MHLLDSLLRFVNSTSLAKHCLMRHVLDPLVRFVDSASLASWRDTSEAGTGEEATVVAAFVSKRGRWELEGCCGGYEETEHSYCSISRRQRRFTDMPLLLFLLLWQVSPLSLPSDSCNKMRACSSSRTSCDAFEIKCW